MEISPGDVLVMKKDHPCGRNQWLVLRTGAELRLLCAGCGHEITVPAFKIEKNIRRVIRKAPQKENENSSTDLSGS